MPYPSTVGVFTNPLPTNRLNSPSHSSIETAQNTALVEIETFVGTVSSAVGTLVYDIRSSNSNGGGHVQTANKGGTGQVSYSKGDLLVASSSSVLSKLSVGTNTQVLQVDDTQSTGVKWGVPLVVRQIQASDFSASGRMGGGVTGSGVITFGSQGMSVDTSGTANSATRAAYQINTNTGMSIFSDNPIFTTNFSLVTAGGTNGLIAVACLGLVTVNASGFSGTEEHIGFKLVRESGAYNLYASQADGATESKTLLTTMVAGDSVDLIAVSTSGASTAYYYRKNNGALSSGVSISTNVPSATTATNHISFGCSNIANSAQLALTFGGFSFQR